MSEKILDRLRTERQLALNGDIMDMAISEIERLRAATETGLEWLRHLEHLGSLVDQEALAGDIAKLRAALGVEQAAERTDG